MDNIPTYIARKHGEESPVYLHPMLKQALKETFGVIIYQEQVMQIAQILAGYSLGEADLLRRAMGKKIRSEMEAQRDIFVDRAVKRGVERQDAKGIFDLIAKFAEYGFNKSHAAAYALIAYQTAYLKANYPVEFIAASMTYDIHNTDKLGVFREEAFRMGMTLLPPDVNLSQVLFAVEHASPSHVPASNPTPAGGGNIRYALAAIRNVGAQAMAAVVAERGARGPYKDIFDFAERVPQEAMNKRSAEHLIKAGAFDGLHSNRAQLMENLDLIVAHGLAAQRERASRQTNLFDAGADKTDISSRPRLKPCADWGTLDKLEHEYSAIGFYLSSHPLAGYKTALERLGVISSSELALKLNAQYRTVKMAGIVTGRKFKVSDKGRFAFIRLSDMAGVFEISVFNEALLAQHRDKLENGKILLVAAEAKHEEAGTRLIAQTISLLDESWAQQRAKGNLSLHIVVDRPEALSSIRDLLGTPAARGATVKLSARLEEAQAEIDLPGRYQVSASIIDRIRIVRGVIHTEEVTAGA